MDSHEVSKGVIFHQNKLLLLLPASKQRWHLPGGHLNVGEDFLKGLKREVYEETGMRVTLSSIVQSATDFRLFICKTGNTNVTLSKEHRDFKWVNIDEAIKMDVTKETRRDLKSVLKSCSMYKSYFTYKTPSSK